LAQEWKSVKRGVMHNAYLVLHNDSTISFHCPRLLQTDFVVGGKEAA